MWAVPSDIELTGLPEDVKPWMLIHKVVGWTDIAHDEVTEDGTEIEHQELWFPILLAPCPDNGGHGPARTWYASIHISETRFRAELYARRALRNIKKQRTQLHQDLDTLLAEQ